VQAPRTDPGTQPATARPNGFTAKALAEVSTRLWRARRHARRLADDGEPDSRSPAALRPLLRELDAALAGLAEAGVDVQTHDGDLFDPGLALLAVAFQPIPGLTREQVLETLRPSIYLGDVHLQRGEVVVAVPEPAGTTPPSGTTRTAPHEGAS